MRKELIQQEYPEIYNNPHDYGLLQIADDSSSFVIIFKRNRAMVVLEVYYTDTVSFLLEQGVDIYDNYNDMLSKLPRSDNGQNYRLDNK